MGHMSYQRVVLIRRSHGTRGFKLSPRRLSVHKLRERFLYLFKVLNRWRSSYGHAIRSLKKGILRSCGKKESIGRRNLVMEEVPNMGTYNYRLKSYGRSNSFYSEAIEDCLEFIKRTSISVDDKSDTES